MTSKVVESIYKELNIKTSIEILNKLKSGRMFGANKEMALKIINDRSKYFTKDIQVEYDDFLKKERENKTVQNTGLFNVHTASDWLEKAKKRPMPKMLFGEFWFEGELCILFADTNLGKSILAVQIANSISKNKPIKEIKLEAEKQKVLYFDFELSDKQFETRYSINFEQHYNFDDNLLRTEINPEYKYDETNESFEEYLYQSLVDSITEYKAKILIIDNITYLKDETEKAKSALPLMKYLQALKKKYGLSILVLAHTPKRDLSKPITKNDLQGSKMLINFADSAFAIGESSQDKNMRYLKQIKVRSTDFIYDTDNVFICQITKPHNFLEFEFLDFGTEQEHLKKRSETDKSELENKVKELMVVEPGITAYAIAKRLCIDESNFNSFKVKITRIVNKINDNNSKNGNT